LQKLIRQGETIRAPGIRRKPVMAALPAGITLEDIRAEVRQLLVEQNVVNVGQQAEAKTWALKVKQWTATHYSKA